MGLKRLFGAIVGVMCVATPLAWGEGRPVCTLGVVPQFDQRRLFEVWQPIADALSTKLPCTVQIVPSSSIADFETAFSEGRYDFAYMNPYHLVMAHKAQGYVPLVRDGSKMLRGILVAAADSPIDTVAQLEGKEVAFPSPNALGASLLMRAELAAAGVSVTPVYVKTHSSVYLHAAKGLAAAGGGVAATLAEQPDAIRSHLKVIYQTQAVPPHPLAVHPRVDAALQAQVQRVWLLLAAAQPELFEGIPMKRPVATTYEDYMPLAALGLEAFVAKED